jgi:hypothetical protein
MIGLDQEPSRATLDALNAELGEGKYRITYRQNPNGGSIAEINLLDVEPPKVISVGFASGLVREQIDALWSETVDRLSKARQHERNQALDPARLGGAAEDRATVDAPDGPPAPPPTAPGEVNAPTRERVDAPTHERADAPPPAPPRTP